MAQSLSEVGSCLSKDEQIQIYILHWSIYFLHHYCEVDEILAFSFVIVLKNAYSVIGGTGQFQARLLLEPKVHPRTAEEKKQLMEDVWPSIKEANKDCPAHGRVMKDFIIPSNPEKPIPRAGKDAVQRHATHKLYENEFKAFYASKHGPVGYAR